MRTAKIAIVALVVLITTCGGIVINDLRYPPEWDQIRLGMPRSQIETLIGPGGGEWTGWSSAYWEDRGLLIRNELAVYMDPAEGATIIAIKRISTVPGEHNLWTVRAEYAHPAQPSN